MIEIKQRRRLPIDLGGSHYLIELLHSGWAVSIFRDGRPADVISVGSKPEAVRLARDLSDDGLIGIVEQVP